jgi:hypothetical protein
MGKFKVVCMECGKETIFGQDKYIVRSDNEDIDISSYPAYDDSSCYEIECKCGNKIET